jgi:hypothetical protein
LSDEAGENRPAFFENTTLCDEARGFGYALFASIPRTAK